MIMLFITFFWINKPYVLGDEAFLMKWTILVKKQIFNIDPKPKPEEVLFVDVSKSKALLADQSQFGGESPYNKKVITDRGQLIELMDALLPYKEDIRFVLMDILLEDASPVDSLLQDRIAALGDKFLGVSHLEEGKQLIQPVISIPYGLATYKAVNELFVKYPLLLADSLKTVPLILLEKTEDKYLQKNRGIYRIDGKWNFSSIILDFRIRPSDFQSGSSMDETNFAIYELGTILESQDFMDEKDRADFFSNKAIIIGDFISDLHETPIGEIAGPLILFNAYLTLKDQGNEVPILWLFFLFFGFLLLSYRVISDRQMSQLKWVNRVFKSKIWRILLTTIDEALILSIITIISFFFFGLHINVFMLLLYIILLEGVRKAWEAYRKGKIQSN